ncbi:MAG TPA: hypothetical protein VGG03_03190 [Thermoanaerobaculia bacterium]|jgi:hypothetical protein
MWTFCLYFPLHRGSFNEEINRPVCFVIHSLIEFPRAPRPRPWLFLDGKPFELGHDIQVLTTIADLSRELSPDFGRPLNAGIEQALSSLKKQLPEGATLNYQAGTQTAA